MAEFLAEEERGFAAGLVTAMADGGVSLPYVFLKHYHKLGITDAEAMLMIQLMAFREKDEKSFPTIEEIQSRMSSDGDAVVRMLQRLMKQRLIDIVESYDSASGMHVERYSLIPLWMRLAAIIAREETRLTADASGQPAGTGTAAYGASLQAEGAGEQAKQPEENIFYIFEQEFGRPLSPMEVDMINGWIDQDRYPEPLILAALKESVFAGKVSFRYIDRILLDWNRNNIHTVEQAREYTQKFRSAR
ncbi:DNA replication protein DnaD [Insulibacter thermoxylanivorax]|uniref:DNA replication protein DnaD n=1 Tax=Insulibacter thermoxylanivorax TaxID=2749268 RepID=A0A916QA01_9BACL|nr:DnaD domain protein [Insulibacter thermoxylanivorax]GFR36932.1 DNA replication protein DnaD [Insulibacter thermoxylanivorax]